MRVTTTFVVLEAEVAQASQLHDAFARLAQVEAALSATKAALAQVTAERDKLLRAYELLKEQYEVLRRRIFEAKAERIDVKQLEIEFADVKKKLDALAAQVAETAPAPPSDAAPLSPPPAPPKERPKPKGRRNLAEQDLPEERIEIVDPAFAGKPILGFEESSKLKFRRGGPVRLVIARALYKSETPKSPEERPAVELVTALMPKELFPRGLLAPSMIAHIVVRKYRWGLPFHRLALMLSADGVEVHDSTMCRYAEHLGATLGCIVEACTKEAMKTASCLSTDATGVCIQPVSTKDGRRQACRKGHFFVVLADKDYVFFEYQPKHTSAAVCDMFRGFKGYIQADAHAIYDAVFRGEARGDPKDPPPKEVGCWAHGRRKFWDAAAVTHDVAAREALFRMHQLFELEEAWKPLSPAQRLAMRQRVARPLVDDFFAWLTEQYHRVKDTRGLVATAFGYAARQKDALRRFLEDGRLAMTNNHSERALRHIAVGRRAWLFFGTDDHASAAANHFSLIASCELHRLDPETYFAEVIHVLPYWPRDRYLELAPKFWRATRARIPAAELALEIGTITVPPPLPTPDPEEKTPAD